MRKFLILAIVLYLVLATGTTATSALEDKVKTHVIQPQLSESSLTPKVEVRIESNDMKNNTLRSVNTSPTPITAKGVRMESNVQDSSNFSSLSTYEYNDKEHRRRTKRAVDKLLRNYRTGKLRAVGDTVSYHCYKTVHKDDSGRNRVKRGCIKVPEELSACEMLQETTSNMQKCKICTTAKCNSSSAVGVSMIVIGSVVIFNSIIHLRGHAV